MPGRAAGNHSSGDDLSGLLLRPRPGPQSSLFEAHASSKGVLHRATEGHFNLHWYSLTRARSLDPGDGRRRALHPGSLAAVAAADAAEGVVVGGIARCRAHVWKVSETSRTWSLLVFLAIGVSSISDMVDTELSVPGVRERSPGGLRATRWIELITMSLFSIELVVRLACCPSRLRFFRSAFNWIDVIAVVPWWATIAILAASDTPLLGIPTAAGGNSTTPGSGAGAGAGGGGGGAQLGSLTSMIRLLRLLRATRLLKFTSYSSSARIFFLTVRQSVQSAGFMLASLCFLLLIFASLLHAAESAVTAEARQDSCGTPCLSSTLSASWSTINTLTSTGYGDSIPHTAIGKGIACLTMVSSVILLAMPIAVVENNYAKLQASHTWCLRKKQQLLRSGVVVADAQGEDANEGARDGFRDGAAHEDERRHKQTATPDKAADPDQSGTRRSASSPVSSQHTCSSSLPRSPTAALLRSSTTILKQAGTVIWGAKESISEACVRGWIEDQLGKGRLVAGPNERLEAERLELAAATDGGQQDPRKAALELEDPTTGANAAVVTLNPKALMKTYGNGKPFLNEEDALMMIADIEEYHTPDDTTSFNAVYCELEQCIASISSSIGGLEAEAFGDKHAQQQEARQLECVRDAVFAEPEASTFKWLTAAKRGWQEQVSRRGLAANWSAPPITRQFTRAFGGKWRGGASTAGTSGGTGPATGTTTTNITSSCSSEQASKSSAAHGHGAQSVLSVERLKLKRRMNTIELEETKEYLESLDEAGYTVLPPGDGGRLDVPRHVLCEAAACWEAMTKNERHWCTRVHY
jgi:hypothetical protein